MAITVSAGDSFAAGIVAQAFGTYRKAYETQKAALGMMMNLDFPSTRRTEIHFYWEAAPYLVRWPDNTDMRDKPFRGVQYTIVNHAWARSVSWNWRDARDDQTSQMTTQARDIGRNAAELDERVAYQILTNTPDLDLLPSVPNGPDGNAINADVLRFGAAGGGAGDRGNLINGNGVASSAAIRQDYYGSIGRASQYQNTESQPLLPANVVGGRKMVTFNPANIEVFLEAFVQQRTLDGGAAVTNLVLDTQQAPELWPNQRIVDNDWWVHFADGEIKAMVSQAREPMREEVATMSNSDDARIRGTESVRFIMVKGFGVNLPYPSIKIDN